MATTEQISSLEYMYATALLLKLYKAKIISREVYESAEKKCREKLAAT